MNISTATEADFVEWFAGADGKRARRLDVENGYAFRKYTISADFLYTPVDDEDGKLRWVNKQMSVSKGKYVLFDNQDQAEEAIRKMGLWNEYEKKWDVDEEGNKSYAYSQYSPFIEDGDQG